MRFEFVDDVDTDEEEDDWVVSNGGVDADTVGDVEL
jgi:hypothetical protein